MKWKVAKGTRFLPLAFCQLGVLSQSDAAEAPAGTQLSDTQRIVINNGSEVASRDPQKIEPVPYFLAMITYTSMKPVYRPAMDHGGEQVKII